MRAEARTLETAPLVGHRWVKADAESCADFPKREFPAGSSPLKVEPPWMCTSCKKSCTGIRLTSGNGSLLCWACGAKSKEKLAECHVHLV
jgi:hypothetical protein